jgi:hypothetical protein
MIGRTDPFEIRRHRIIRNILLLSISCFFLAVLAIAFHHHDNAFWLRVCSICKVKTSISGTISKQTIDLIPAIALLHLQPTAILPGLCGAAPNRPSEGPCFRPAFIFPNKAPPVLS